MPNDEPTLPPIGARTPRNIGRWLFAWAGAHQAAVAIAAGMLTAFILGAVLL